MRRRTARAAAVLLLAACLPLTACTTRSATPVDGGTVTVTATPTSPPPSTSSSVTASPTTARPPASPSASSGRRADPNAPAGQCSDARLDVSVQADPRGSGAGQRTSYVVFRNSGTTSCALRGWAGVSLVGRGDGTRIGAAATEAGALQPGIRTVAIGPGSYALASLSYPYIDANGGAYGAGAGKGDPKCRAQQVDGYRVYPPHGYRAFFSRATGLYGCSTQLHALFISPVVPASSVDDFTPKP